MRFRDRRDAGKRLAQALAHYQAEQPIVLALPRGGVPVGEEVARALGAPLDVLVVRKLGAPFQPELGVGAIAEGGVVWVDEELCASLGIDDDALAALAAEEQEELSRRVRAYRGARPPLEVADRTVIVVDDGVATGGTARAALRAARERGAKRLVFAAPVAAAQSVPALLSEADELVYVTAPDALLAIGLWYRDFRQVGDDEVRACLERARTGAVPPPAPEEAVLPAPEPVEIFTDEGVLRGDLTVPDDARGLVIFAHGSGSSRFSPRNRFVAQRLNAAGLATLLLDLLTEEEEDEDRRTAALRFDIPLLARRLAVATDWALENERVRGLRIGYFGSSTGAAAALIAAAERADVIGAVVSRGGRPDLARGAFADVRAPTLLLVGGDDTGVLALNEDAAAALACETKLTVIPGASHLFEEPGALEQVADLAAGWFERHLAPEEAAAHP